MIEIKPRAQPNRQKLTQAMCERMHPPTQGYLTVWDTGLPALREDPDADLPNDEI
jgi:hypothetical protein